MSNDVERSRRFYQDNGFTIPAAFDPDQEVSASTYGVIATPTNYLLDGEGRIVWRHYGYRPGDEEVLRSRIERLLGDTSSGGRSVSPSAGTPEGAPAAPEQ